MNASGNLLPLAVEGENANVPELAEFLDNQLTGGEKAELISDLTSST